MCDILCGYMPLYQDVLATDQFYHIFNKSVADELMLTTKYHVNRWLELVEFCRFKGTRRYSMVQKLPMEQRKTYIETLHKQPTFVEIYAFACMPNHYHLLLKQLEDNGVSTFISNLQNSFAKYFNTKHKRNGSLFLSPFKRIRIERDEVFMHVSRYIHLNPVTSYLIKEKELKIHYSTSLSHYNNPQMKSFVERSKIIRLFGSLERYNAFIFDQVDYQQKLALIKKHTL